MGEPHGGQRGNHVGWGEGVPVPILSSSSIDAF